MQLDTEINRVNNKAERNQIGMNVLMRRTSNMFYNLRDRLINNYHEDIFSELKTEMIRLLLCLFCILNQHNKKTDQSGRFNIFIKKYKTELKDFEKIVEMINSENKNVINEIDERSEEEQVKYLIMYFSESYSKFRCFLALYYSSDKTDPNIINMINEQIGDLILELSVIMVGAISGEGNYKKKLNEKEKGEFLDKFRILIAENDWVVFTPDYILLEELELKQELYVKIQEEVLSEKTEKNIEDLLWSNIRTLKLLLRGY